jgi:histidinol dehydrogenase
MNETINPITLSDLSPSQRNRLLQRRENDLTPILEKVKPIIQAVRLEGDQALARFARQFDKAVFDASAIAATPDDFDRAQKELEPDARGRHRLCGGQQLQIPQTATIQGVLFGGNSPRPARR